MTKKPSTAELDAFRQAVRNYDLDAARAILASGISPESVMDGVTPLFLAAECGHPDLVRILLEAGANPNRRMRGKAHDQIGSRTALNVAAGHGSLACVEQLLNAKADPSSADDNLRTAGHLLVSGTLHKPGSQFSHVSAEWLHRMYSLLNRMLENGLPVNQQDSTGKTILHHAVIESAPGLVMDLLFRHGASPYVKDQEGLTPFHLACQEGRVKHYDMFVRQGVDTGVRTLDGRYALHVCDDEASFDQIMEYQPDLEARDHYGRTPLADALHNLKLGDWKGKAIRLIAAGARLDAPDHEGVTPADLIKRKNLTEVAAFVAAMRARQTMGQSIKCGRVAAARTPAP